MEDSIIKKFGSRFKQLNKGVIRLLIVGWAIIPMLIAGYISSINSDYGFNDDDYVGTFIIFFILYWFIIRIVLWIYDGFKENENTNNSK
ncbi:MAG: hypothetical protein K1X33_09125 [Methanobacteriaceae archaeon]|nr:hypothetical protein [Methanobacteriaceae archaeon]